MSTMGGLTRTIVILSPSNDARQGVVEALTRMRTPKLWCGPTSSCFKVCTGPTAAKLPSKEIMIKFTEHVRRLNVHLNFT